MPPVKTNILLKMQGFPRKKENYQMILLMRRILFLKNSILAINLEKSEKQNHFKKHNYILMCLTRGLKNSKVPRRISYSKQQ